MNIKWGLSGWNSRGRQRVFGILAAIATMCQSGCQSDVRPTRVDRQESVTESVEPQAAAMVARDLRLLVINDPAIVDVARREWQAISDTNLDVTQQTESEFLASLSGGSVAADIIIYSTRLMGELAHKNRTL